MLVGVSDDRRHHVESRPLKARPATLRSSSAGVVGRWSTANYGIGGLLAVAVWSELGDCRRFSRSEQVVRHSGLDVTVDPRTATEPAGSSDPSRAPDVALGAVRGSEERVAPTQPRPRLLHHGQGPSQRQAGRHLRRPSSSPDAASTSCATSIPTSSTRCRPDHHCQVGGRHRPHQHHGSLPRSAPATGVPASLRAGRPSNTDATAHPASRGTPNQRLLSPTTHVRRAPRKRRAPPRRRQPAHSQSAPALGLVKVVRPRFAAGAPPNGGTEKVGRQRVSTALHQSAEALGQDRAARWRPPSSAAMMRLSRHRVSTSDHVGFEPVGQDRGPRLVGEGTVNHQWDGVPESTSIRALVVSSGARTGDRKARTATT